MRPFFCKIAPSPLVSRRNYRSTRTLATWFTRTFPDDIGEPFQYLCWTLALYRSGDRKNAARKLAQTWFKNPYLVLRLLGTEQQKIDFWHSSNWEQPEYLEAGPSELLDLWNEDALAWAKEVYEEAWFKQVRATYLEMQRRLTNEPVGPERSRLVSEIYWLMALEGVETGS